MRYNEFVFQLTPAMIGEAQWRNSGPILGPSRDSQASSNVNCNPELVSNIRPHPNGNRMTIHCNAGSVIIDTVTDFPGFGIVGYHAKSAI